MTTNLNYLENNVLRNKNNEAFDRLQYNKKLIGKKVFVVNFGGWYGHVLDMGSNIDEYLIQRPNGNTFPVSIFDVRQLDYDIMANEGKKISEEEFSLEF